MPYGRADVLMQCLTELGADPAAFKKRPSWTTLQQPGTMMTVFETFRDNLGLTDEDLSHLRDDVPSAVLETAREHFVREIEAGRPVSFRLSQGDGFSADFADGAITIQLPSLVTA